jgi:enamine deaminase RidA (YjgF/YER057c/UK114 family)
MIRALSLTAALALLPLSSALAQEAPPRPGSAEARLEEASKTFEARMETFGERAEAISEDESLSDGEKSTRISALWGEYAPAIAAFTAEATRQASAVAAEALKDIDVDALVADALNDPEVQQAMENGMAAGTGVIRNSAWTNPDPEQMETYGLIAQYTLDQAGDAVDAAEGLEMPEALEPPEPPEAPEPTA